MEKDSIIDANAVAVNLRVARARKNMTQSELAERAGVALSTISFIENGKHMAVRVPTISKLASALEVSVESLLQA